ncbi:MAG: sigma-70 family RNA polymerase sigma factor [Clostridia bacterium]|nr:sigma-70 family RNA polymerase sigma factor [Clostridia bacterium]
MDRNRNEMTDGELTEMLLSRSEKALELLEKKYGKLCMHIARNVLCNDQDAEECVNDTYLRVWHSIPPNRPDSLLSYTLTIVRNLSLNRLLYNKAEKRAGNEGCISLSELDECLESLPQEDSGELKELMNRFLDSLSEKDAVLFVRRYWYMDSVQTLCHISGYSENNVYQRLFVMRKKLRSLLKKEGYDL